MVRLEVSEVVLVLVLLAQRTHLPQLPVLTPLPIPILLMQPTRHPTPHPAGAPRA